VQLQLLLARLLSVRHRRLLSSANVLSHNCNSTLAGSTARMELRHQRHPRRRWWYPVLDRRS
jgi:hypothetical protein